MAIYYVKNGGNDALDGLTDSTAWATIAKVNAVTLAAGDSVLFKRGDSWRECLLPDSGTSGNVITYGAYGTGDKPILYGSRNKHDTSIWTEVAGNIWQCNDTPVTGSELLTNPSFTSNLTWWNHYNEDTGVSAYSRTTTSGEWDSTPAGCKVVCTNTGAAPKDIQVYTTGVGGITIYKTYRLTFRAKASVGFSFDAVKGISLNKKTASYDDYFSARYGFSPTITTDWATYNVYFVSNITASDARITLYLGSSLPSGATLYIDTFSFKECTDNGFPNVDVGNIIFNDEYQIGVKKWEEADLASQGDFWYDETNDLVKLYSVGNPATFYSDIEFAMRTDIIDGAVTYATFENLHLKYGAGHGMGFNVGSSDVTVQDCDLRYIGGGDKNGGAETVRYGNGVEFWRTGTNILVQRNTFTYCFDEAFSIQGNTTSTFSNVKFINNIYSHCRTGITIAIFTGTATVENVYYENNTCIWGSTGWNIQQKTGSTSFLVGLDYYVGTTVTFSNINVRNNIFYGGDGGLDKQVSWVSGFTNLTMDHNSYYRADGGALIRYESVDYTASTFSTYQSLSGQDSGSSLFNPNFNATTYMPISTSPCVGAGVAVAEVTSDYNKVWRADPPDIGAVEYVDSTATGKVYYVDATNGLDSNTGLTTSAPWKTIAKVNASLFNPGDSILFKRGEMWRETLKIFSAGEAGKPIIFSNYGSGAIPIIDGSDIVTSWIHYSGGMYYTYCNETSSVWEDGMALEYVDYAKTSTLPSAGQFISIDAGAGNWVTVVNCTDSEDPATHTLEIGARNVGIWVSHNAGTSARLDNHHVVIDGICVQKVAGTYSSLTGGSRMVDANSDILEYGIIVSGGSYNTVRNCTVRYCGGGRAYDPTDAVYETVWNACIEFYKSPYGEAYNNTCHDGSTVGLNMETLDNDGEYYTMYNNTVHDMWNIGINFSGGDCYSNTVYNIGLSGTYSYANGGASLTLFSYRSTSHIYNNRFYNCLNGVYTYGAANSAYTIYLYNNLFYGLTSYATYIATGTKNLTFYHNTFVCSGTEGWFIGSDDITVNDNIVFKNNIIRMAAGICFNHRNALDTNIVFSYNCYYRADGGSFGEWAGVVYPTFAAYSAANTADVGSINGDPRLTSLTDLHLQGNSPCIDSGTNTFLVTDDFDGNARPNTGRIGGNALYDMGAFEFSTSFDDFGGLKYNEHYLYSEKVWEMIPSGVSFYNLSQSLHSNAPVVVTSSGYQYGLDDPWARTGGQGKWEKVGYGHFTKNTDHTFNESKNQFCVHPDASGKLLFNKVLSENVFVEYEGGPSGYYIMDSLDYNPVRNEVGGGFVHFSQVGVPTDLYLTSSQTTIYADGRRGCTLTAVLYDNNYDRVDSRDIVFELIGLEGGYTPVSGVYSGVWSENGYILPNNGSTLEVDASGYGIKILERTNSRGECHVHYRTHAMKTGITSAKAWYVNASGVYDIVTFAQYYYSYGPFILDISMLDTLDYLTADAFVAYP